MAAVAPLDDPTVTSSWAGPMLLGPLIPTCVALVTIVAAQYVQLTDSVCKPPDGVKNGGCAALSLAVICSYLQVLIFSWVYLGTTVTITLGSKSFKVLKPFSRLRTVVALYGFVAVFSVAAFAMGLLWVVSPEGKLPAIYRRKGNLRNVELQGEAERRGACTDERFASPEHSPCDASRLATLLVGALLVGALLASAILVGL